MAHIHAENMRLYAEDAAKHDKPWELWENQRPARVYTDLGSHPSWSTDTTYRRKRLMSKIIHVACDGTEVVRKYPTPSRVAPASGIRYWRPLTQITAPHTGYSWVVPIQEHLDMGIHFNQMDALAHYKAIYNLD